MTASCAIQIAVAHVDDCDVLAMTASVLVVSIVQSFAPRGADQLPILALRFFGITVFDAGRTACQMSARGGGFNTVILTPICVAAAKPEEAIVAITFRVRPDQLPANSPCRRRTSRLDTMRAFRRVA